MTTSSLMIDDDTAPVWLKLFAAIGIVWYAFGLVQFWLGYSMDTASAIAQGAMTPAHAAAVDATPELIWLAFALASVAGVAGASLLFVRSAHARAVFAVSLGAAALYYLWVYGLSGTGADRPAEELIIACVVGAITFGFYMVSRRMT